MPLALLLQPLAFVKREPTHRAGETQDTWREGRGPEGSTEHADEAGGKAPAPRLLLRARAIFERNCEAE